MLADAPVDIAALAVVGVKHAQVAGLGVVGAGEVRRATHSFRHQRVDDGQRHFRGFAGGDLGLVFAHLLFQRFDGGRQFLGRIQSVGAVEAVLLLLREPRQSGLPRLHARTTPRAPMSSHWDLMSAGTSNAPPVQP